MGRHTHLKCCTMHHTFEFAFVVAAHCRRGSSDVLPTLHAAQAMQFGPMSPSITIQSTLAYT